VRQRSVESCSPSSPCARQQDLIGQRELHQPRRDRLDQAFDLDQLGALGDVVRRVVPRDHVADVHADARGERGLLVGGELLEAALIIEREGDRLDRAVEHHQEAVGLVDFAAVVGLQQRARQAVVFAKELGGTLVAQAFDQSGGIDEVAQHERAQQRHGRRVGGVGGLGECVHDRSSFPSRRGRGSDELPASASCGIAG
jgi:hypothetical protein